MDSNQKNKSIRFKEAFDYLKENGIINNQKDLAEKLRVTQETITRVMKCQGNNPSDKFLEKFAAIFKDIFNESYIINGVGTLLVIKEPKLENQVSIIESLLKQLENKDKQLENRDKTIAHYEQQIVMKDKKIEELTAIINSFKSTSINEQFEKTKVSIV